MTQAIVVMGVSGSGKTTVGKALAKALDCPFYDGDDFHPPENRVKMASGIALDDSDRYPWLLRLRDLIVKHLDRDETIVVACSALKEKYRDLVSDGRDDVVFVYLHGDFDLLWERMQARKEHYMKPDMLKSQFEALEPPNPDEAIHVDSAATTEQIVRDILIKLSGA